MGYWAQWRSFAARVGMLEHHWEPADRQSYLRGKEEGVLAELHTGPQGGHLDVSRTFDKVRQWYYWLQARNDVDRSC